MEEEAKVRVWLTAIEYTGGNVGSDTDFAVTVNGRTVQVTSDIKAGTRKGFDKPLLEESADDDEVKVAIAVKVVEEDALVDDVGQNQAEHRIVKGWRRQALHPLRVSVQENRVRVPPRSSSSTSTQSFLPPVRSLHVAGMGRQTRRERWPATMVNRSGIAEWPITL